jgi:transposase
VIAHFAEATDLEPRPFPDEATRLLVDLVARRRQIIEMIGAERQRGERTPARLKKSIARLIKALARSRSSVAPYQKGRRRPATRGWPTHPLVGPDKRGAVALRQKLSRRQLEARPAR